MAKKKIAIDIDDVLAANAEGFVRFSNERWGTNLTVDDYEEHWGRVWRIEHDHVEIEKRAAEFHMAGIVGKFDHFPEAELVLKELARHFDLVIVTSRRLVLMPETEAWLSQHFAGVFKEVHYAGIWDKPGKNRISATKAELCAEIGADYLVDDQLKHCLAAADAGIPAVLYGDYPWNRADELPGNVVRCHTWKDVAEHFAKQKA